MIELMVTSTIGLILLSAIVQIFLSYRQSYRLTENISDIQEGGRIATDLLSRDIRMAGFSGCIATFDNPNIIVDLDADGTTDGDYDAIGQGGIIVHNPDAAPAHLPSVVKLARSGTDIIEIQRADEFGLAMSELMTTNNADLEVLSSDSIMLRAEDVLIVSDCESADIFAASSVSTSSDTTKITVTHSDSTNIDNSISKAYNTNARLYRYRRIFYYIKINTVSNRPSLYRWDSTDGDLELVTDVDDLQVLLNERIGTSVSLVSPASVTNYLNVLSVHMALLLRSSDDNLRTQSQTLSYNGKDGSAYVDSDKRLRTIFYKTVTLRNR